MTVLGSPAQRCLLLFLTLRQRWTTSVRTDWTETETGPRDRFGLGLISMTGLSVRSCNFSEPSVRSRSRSKRYGPIGRTRTEPRYCSMTVSINQTFKALYHATYQYFNLTDTEVSMHR